MQTFKQTKEIFEISRRFHRQLSDLYHGLGERAERKRVKMLLAYLSRHEHNLETCLEGYEDKVAEAVLSTWFQYVPEAEPFSRLATVTLRPDMSMAEVATLALELDDAIIEFYATLAEEADSKDVRELFENLLQMETHEEIALKREVFGV